MGKYYLINLIIISAFSVMETSCVHHSDSSFPGACGRTWSRSWVWSQRRSAYEPEPCAGQWHWQRSHTHLLHSMRYKQKRNPVNISLTPVLHQVVLSGRSDCVLSCRAGDWPLLCCRGNGEVQETSICGAVGFKSCREVLLCKALCECVYGCVFLCAFISHFLHIPVVFFIL